jgi:endonuclease YncB( thermonuclease family)
MRLFVSILAATLLGLTVSAAGYSQDPGKPDSQPQVVKEEVHGQWRQPTDKLHRITGKVKVIDAHTLRYADGTIADLNGGMDAPDLDQKGRSGDSFYPCGKEAAEFLEKLIGGREVTCYSGDAHVEPRQFRIASAFVGETNLNIEMVRNGWAMAHHSGMAAWEVFARENKRGLWRGTFVFPENWRKGKRLPGEK